MNIKLTLDIPSVGLSNYIGEPLESVSRLELIEILRAALSAYVQQQEVEAEEVRFNRLLSICESFDQSREHARAATIVSAFLDALG